MLAVITLSVSSNLPYRVKVPENKIIFFFSTQKLVLKILLNIEKKNFVVFLFKNLLNTKTLINY